MPSGQSKYSHSLIYTRSERVGGSKVADDTLTTLSHALLGYKTATFQQPQLYRTGYDDNGLINVMVDEEQPNIDDHVQGDQECENSNSDDDEIRHNFISVKESGGSDGATNEVEEGTDGQTNEVSEGGDIASRRAATRGKLLHMSAVRNRKRSILIPVSDRRTRSSRRRRTSLHRSLS